MAFDDAWSPVTNAIDTGTFDPVGMNYPSATWGTPGGKNTDFSGPQILPGLGSNFAPSETSKGNVVVSSGGAGSGSPLNLGTFALAGSNGAPVNAGHPLNVTVKNNTFAGSGSMLDYFLRGIIVILGFIFVAVGLNKLAPSVVPDIRNVVR